MEQKDPLTHLFFSQIFEPGRDPTAVPTRYDIEPLRSEIILINMPLFTSSKLSLIYFFWISVSGATSHLAEYNHSSNLSSEIPSSCSKSKNSLEVAFAPTAEAKKAGRASRRVESSLSITFEVFSSSAISHLAILCDKIRL